MPYQTNASIEEIVDLYDGFILDQFGVLHNGAHGLEGAPECVKALHAKGKKLIILSNSSSPSAAAIAKLPKLGYDPSMLVGAVTSGQEAIKYLAETYPGKKAIFFTWDKTHHTTQQGFLEKCGGIQPTNSVEEADFVLLHGVQVLLGPNGDETSLDGYMQTGDMSSVIEPMLKKCAARNLPMVCANPDFIMVRPDGTNAHMPGKLAKKYEELGGSCTSFGKPHAAHFEACVREIGLPKDKVVHVGDSLHHDIAGANAAGIASVFVVGGVHREEVGSKLGEMPPRDKLDELFAQHSQTPTHVVPMFRM
ncbi:Inherit from COG: Hydrolase [Seminavis robusta]|uniref:Inherit from COG: Hydrolase n=1 Tax=Seminavis robusta TaxID=568900 RepID=A0A9N8E5D8_9STRA|nr:Inherit from COG: Hydrolase [Seminavis robusta]|eukprot:Sro691_g187750.1 Inherit from COG: Hydrolase (307) ;mRNA; r:6762-7772